jgi:uncharacterized membrane protein
MRILPRISLPTHGLAELTLGILLTIGAFVLDLGDTGTVAMFIAGFALTGVGIGAASEQPLAVQRLIDSSLVVAFAGLAILCAAAGNALAAVLLLTAAGFVTVVEASTRWTRPLM